MQPTIMAHYEDSVYNLSREKAIELLPVVIAVGLLMLVGLIGNPLVVYFYGFRMKPTASYMFIVTLAVCDIITCSISMPMEIVDMVEFYSFENTPACKIFRFVNYFASLASGLILIAIAVDRFRKICCPFDAQITNQMAKWIIFGSFGISSLLSWPSAVFYDVIRVNITEDPSAVGFDCTTSRDENFKIFITVYNILLFFLFFVTMITLIVLYCLVGRQLFQLRKFRFFATERKHSQSASTVVTSHTLPSVSNSDEKKSSSVSDEKKSNEIYEQTAHLRCHENKSFAEQEEKSFGGLEKPDDCGHRYDIYEMSNKHSKDGDFKELKPDNQSNSFSQEESSGRNRSVSNGKGLRQKSSSTSGSMQQQNINTRKYTIITISITVAFIVSFLPHLALVTWRTLAKDYEANLLSGSGFVAFQFFVRSQLLSSACNPVIYGFLNTEFKAMVLNKAYSIFCCLCCKCSRRTGRKTTGDTSIASVITS